MLDIKVFRDQPELVTESLAKRGENTAPVETVRTLDRERRDILGELEALRAERNTASKAIGQTKDPAEREAKIAAVRDVKVQIEALDSRLDETETKLNAALETIPNIPREDVPVGDDENANTVVRTWGDAPSFDFEPKAHWDLGPERGLIDFDSGVRISGSRFYVLHGKAARLQRGLIQFFLDTLTGRGYDEVQLPYIVLEECLYRAGQLPKFEDNLYRDRVEGKWLVPTAEVPLTNLHADEILDLDSLPRQYVAYTPCFRREQMSAGRDVRGIKRGHQFDKVEMYKFTRPEDSAAALDSMLADGESLLQALGIPYRILQICTGDLGFGSTITYDLEVWAAGCGEWLEVSSISDFGSFQARRSGIRFRRESGGKTEFVHTLNGSGLALPRVMIALLENGQNEDGIIQLPDVLHDRLGMSEI